MHFVGSCSYVSQQPWVLNATVRDNVLFGQSMDEAKYRRAVTAAALDADLQVRRRAGAHGQVAGTRGAGRCTRSCVFDLL